MALDQLTITHQGLLNINRKIINDRKFANSIFTNVGSVNIENGIASDFTNEGYLYKNNIKFTGNKLTIIFEGTFVTSLSDSNQVAWYLSGEGNPCFLQFTNNYPQLVLPEGSTIDFDYLIFKDEMYFKVITTLTSSSCEVIVDIYDEVFSKNISLSSEVPLNSFTGLYLGNDPTLVGDEENYYWEGSINVKNFTINVNDESYFTSTTGYTLQLTDILISDGQYALPQTEPLSISKHMYHYPVEEVSRSGNTLLLVTHLDGDSKLTIREIGLYAKEDGKSFLFGYLKNLNINKGSDVPYDLFLTVNLTMSMVNVVGFPKANSFILKQVKSALLKDFKKAMNVNAYAIGNLERIIRMNSLQDTSEIGYNYRTKVITENEEGHPYDEHYEDGIECCTNPISIQSIGYNTPQTVYRVQKEISEAEDCYSAIQTYSKLKKNIVKATDKIFDKFSIETVGTMHENQTGLFSDFSVNNYISIPQQLLFSKDFEFITSFSIKDFSTDDRYILSLNSIDYVNLEEEGTINTVTPYLFLYVDTDNNLILNSSTLISSLDEEEKYFIKLSYDASSPNSLDIYKSLDGENYSKITTISGLPTIDYVNSIYIGVECSYHSNEDAIEELTISNPFTEGSIDLMDWNIIQEDNNWEPYEIAVVKDAELLQYFHIPDYSKLSYTIEDICNPEYTLSIMDDSMLGNGDLINFKSNDSFSLCLKVDLKNLNFALKQEEENYRQVESRVILAKLNEYNEALFKLEFIKNPIIVEEKDSFDFSIVFTLMAGNDSIVLAPKNNITLEGVSEYTESPILITILKTSGGLWMYRNNELIATATTTLDSLPVYARGYLANYITGEGTGRYVRDIIGMSGVITSNELYYITNLTDTNYNFNNLDNIKNLKDVSEE